MTAANTLQEHTAQVVVVVVMSDNPSVVEVAAVD